MILKPCRINVRFTQLELQELKELWPIAGVHDWTNFTRKAFAQYRRDLLADKQRFTTPTPTETRSTMPALSDKDKRSKKKKPAAVAKSTRSDKAKAKVG